MRKVLAVTGAALLAGAAVGMLALTRDDVQESLPAAPDTSTALQVIDACGTSPQDQKAACLVEATLSAYEAIGDLPALLSAVEERVSTQQEFQGVNCHGTFHEIGKRAFLELGDSALSQGVASCSGGYYHGVLQAGGNVAEARAMCDTLTEDEERADCMHGAGHAIYLIEPDLSNALEYCAGDKQQVCVAGYFMELAETNERDPKALNYCAEASLDADVLFSCYNGLLSDIAISYPKEVAAWCAENATDESMQPLDCWGQLGSGVASGVNERESSNDAKAAKEVEALCEGKASCLASAARVLNNYVNRPEVADMVCTKIEARASDLGNYGDGCPALSS